MAYLQGSSLTVPSNAISTDAIDVHEHVTFSVAVRRPNQSGVSIAEHADGIANDTHSILSHAEFAHQFGADTNDITAIIEFANRHDLTVVSSNLLGATVKLLGTVASINNVFKITLSNIVTPNNTYRSYIGTISIPDELDGIIEHFIGLHNPVEFKKHGTKFSTQVVQGLTPLQVAAGYRFPNSTGAGQCIGLIEIGGGYTSNNLSSSFNNIGLVPPTVRYVGVDNTLNSPGLTTDPENPSVEIMLDIFVAGAVAPGATIIVYNGTSDLAGLVHTFQAAIYDQANRPSVLSVSLGLGDRFIPSDIRSIIDNLFQQAAILGITICVSTGDDGSEQYDSVSNTYAVDTSYPASSPYVLAIGGTELQVDQGITETAWNTNGTHAGGASGGGITTYALPSWQRGRGLSYTTYPSGIRSTLTNRGIPDVSANASPRSGYNFFVGSDNGHLFNYGGTSAAAPLWAGLIARFNALNGYRTGFINPILYANSTSFVVNDVAGNGNNSITAPGYSSTFGWDAVTGLGSPNGLAIYDYLQVPVASNSSVTIPYGYQNFPINISATHGPTGVLIVGPPTFGLTTQSGTTIYYTGDRGYVGPDSIRFRATNAYGTSNTATILITIASPLSIIASDTTVEVPYNAVNDIINLNINTPATLITLTSQPKHGKAVVYGDNILLYTPNTGYVGTDSFTYTVSNDGGTSGEATVYITVLPPAPFSIDVTQSVPYESVDNLINLLIGNQPTAVYVVSSASHGVVYSGGTTIYYTPDKEYVGPDSFTYNASNGSGIGNTATVSITVLPPAPTVVYNFLKTVEYGSVNNLLGIATAGATYTGTSIVVQPEHGSAYVANKAMYYTPTKGYYGSDTLSYVVLNPGGISNTGTALITVTTPILASSPVPGALPPGVRNVFYSSVTPITASNGNPPYTATVISGSLPLGLSINSTTNILSGITTGTGVFSFTVGIIDSSTPISVSTSAQYSLIIYSRKNTGRFQWVTPDGYLLTAGASQSVNYQLLTNDANATFALSAGALPDGLYLSSAGVIYGSIIPKLTVYDKPFLIRAYSARTNSFADNSLYIVANAVSGPVWNYSSSTAFLLGPSIDHTFIDREYVNVKLNATHPVPTTNPYPIEYKLASPFGTLPNGLHLNSDGTLYGTLDVFTRSDSINTFTFSVSASDGTYATTQTLKMKVLNVNALRADSTVIGFNYKSSIIYAGTMTNTTGSYTSTVYDSVTDLSTIQPPFFLRNSDLGTFISNDNMYTPVTVYDPFPYAGNIKYTAENLPYWLKLDENSGILNGAIPISKNYLTKYSVVVSATKISNYDSNVNTATNTFTFTIVNPNQSIISWVNTGSFQPLVLGQPSRLRVDAKVDGTKKDSLKYAVVNGQLPNGVSLTLDGYIVGTPTSTGTYNVTFLSYYNTTTNYNQTTWNEVVSSGIYPVPFNTLTQVINVLPTNKSYVNLYAKPFLTKLEKYSYNRFINSNAFTNKLIYRPSDSNFGIQNDLKMYIQYGVEDLHSAANYLNSPDLPVTRQVTSSTVAYRGEQTIFVNTITGISINQSVSGDGVPTGTVVIGVNPNNTVRVSNLSIVTESQSISFTSKVFDYNFYKKNLYFGEVKSITAVDDAGVPVYDAVYIEIIDPLEGVNSKFTYNNVTYYPGSLSNMRESLIRLNTGTISINSDFLPLWQQTAKKSAMGFINAAILCYTEPNKGFVIVDNIKSQNLFDFKKINFIMDRFIIENTINTGSYYLMFPRDNI